MLRSWKTNCSMKLVLRKVRYISGGLQPYGRVTLCRNLPKEFLKAIRHVQERQYEVKFFFNGHIFHLPSYNRTGQSTEPHSLSIFESFCLDHSTYIPSLIKDSCNRLYILLDILPPKHILERLYAVSFRRISPKLLIGRNPFELAKKQVCYYFYITFSQTNMRLVPYYRVDTSK